MINPRDRIVAAMMGQAPSLNPQSDPMAQQMAQVTAGGFAGTTMGSVYEEPDNPHSPPSAMPQTMPPDGRYYKPHEQMPLPGAGMLHSSTSGFNSPSQTPNMMGHQIEQWRGDFTDSARRMQRQFPYSR